MLDSKRISTQVPTGPVLLFTFAVILLLLIIDSTMNSENSVILRSIILSSIILGGLFTGVYFLEDNITNLIGKHGDNVATGLKLLSLWLVVSATLRSILSLEKKTPAWKLVLSGIMISVSAVLFYTLFLLIYPQFQADEAGENPIKSTGATLIVMAVIGSICSLIALINARVHNRHLGNLLELLLIVATVALFIYFVTR